MNKFQGASQHMRLAYKKFPKLIYYVFNWFWKWCNHFYFQIFELFFFFKINCIHQWMAEKFFDNQIRIQIRFWTFNLNQMMFNDIIIR